MIIELFFEHLFMVLISGFFIFLFGLILSIIAYLYPKTQLFILNSVDLFQTIPTLAMLGLIMVIFGPSKLTVIIALVLYSLLPVVRSTLSGFKNISESINEAALGMGMSRVQKLFKIDIPMSVPYILSGLKIALVSSIGSAVFAAFVGAGGLGAMLHKGVRTQNMKMISQGTLALVVMSILIEKMVEILERKLLKDDIYAS